MQVCTQQGGVPRTPTGLKPSERNLAAVGEFPVPTNLKHLRQFLGLTLHYNHFIHNYAKIAHPLYALTRKGAQYQWTAECEVAFKTLKGKLLTPPVLAYPDFSRFRHRNRRQQTWCRCYFVTTSGRQ